MAKYKVGDKVKIMEERTYSMPSHGSMDKYLGKVMTIRSTDESGDYKMLEDNGHWSWNDAMIAGYASETEKVTVHPDFEKWYTEIKSHWGAAESHKACAIYLINQMGFGHGLQNSFNRDVSDEHSELRDEMQGNKEKYTRAILDGNWTVRKEKLYYVKLPIQDRDEAFLNYDESDGVCMFCDKGESTSFKTKFTEAKIKAIDERYWAFAVEVEAE